MFLYLFRCSSLKPLDSLRLRTEALFSTNRLLRGHQMGQQHCCCCCPPNYAARSQHQQQQQQQRRGGGGSAGFRQPSTPAATTAGYHSAARPPNVAPNVCRVCGKTCDLVMIDGHEEACRAAAKRDMMHRETDPLMAPPAGACAADAAPAADSGNGGHHECIICLCHTARRVAILPCCHAYACLDCAKKLDECALCRGKKEGLLILTEDPRRCRWCSNPVAPVHYDAHQETCRLRQRQLKEDLKAEFEGGQQQQQQQQQRQHDDEVLLPCGHPKDETAEAVLPCGCLLCGNCSKLKSCPLHLTRILRTIKIYE